MERNQAAQLKLLLVLKQGFLGMQMQGKESFGGDGILVRDVENIIYNVGLLARKGMVDTDKEIVNINDWPAEMLRRCT